jgi:hypothetical protein
MTRPVLAKEPHEPICDPCALGAKARDKVATLSTNDCCLCGRERRCATIRDWHWPQAAHGGDEWICDNCASDRGGRLASGLMRWRENCSVCRRRTGCHRVGEYDWPAAQKRRLHDEYGDHNELEAMLGRRT